MIFRAAGRASLLAVAVCLILWPSNALPQPHSVSTASRRAFLELFVNEVDKGTVLVLMRKPDILARVDDLDAAGLKLMNGRRATIAGTSYVSIPSLAPAVKYSFDAKELVLRLTVNPALLATTSVALRTIRPPEMIALSNPSAFINYGFNARNFNSYNLFTEGGLSLDGNLLYSSLALTPQAEWVRGLTNLTIDKPNRLTRLTVGDTFANTGVLGGGVYLGGVGLARDFALDPYFLPYPTQQLAGETTMPAIADVYVNGTLVSQLNLPPGRFNLRNLPSPAGAGNTQVIVRNLLGQQQTINAPYYLSTEVLHQGLHRYSYNCGFLRSDLGVTSWRYGPPACAASHLYGVTDWLTGGAWFQGDRRVIAGGPQIALRTLIGAIGLAGAASAGHATGGSGAATYSYITPRYSFGGDLTATSRRYATLGLAPGQDRALLQADAFVGLERGRLSIFPTFRYASFRDTGRSWSANLANNWRFSQRMDLQLNLSRSYQAKLGPTTDVFVALDFFFGSSTVGTIAYDHVSGQAGRSGLATVQLQKSLPLGTGYGYRVQGQMGQQGQQSADFQYAGAHGLYEIDYSRLMGRNATNLTISGGLVGIGGHVFASRPVQDSYALIRVPEVGDVTGYYSNQNMGKTDRNGNLFVPDLLSYYGNDLSIDDHDIPVDYAVEATRRIVATSYRGGAVVTFPVHRLRAFIGKLEIISSGGKLIPSYGELAVSAKGQGMPTVQQFSSPIGRDGAFYLESIAAGVWPGVITYQGGQCRLRLAIPLSAERLVTLETVKCVRPYN